VHNHSNVHYKNSTTKLKSYLEILQNPESIKETLTLLLSHNDSSIQLLVLKQLLKLKIPELNKFEKSLLSFSSDNDFKDEVIKFQISTLSETERKVILPYIIRILNTKLLRKVGKSNRKSLETRRKIVYRFLSKLAHEDLEMFISQVIEPFNLTFEDVENQQILEAKLSHCSFAQYLGFISSIEGIVKQMGSLVQDFLPIFCKILITIFKLSK